VTDKTVNVGNMLEDGWITNTCAECGSAIRIAPPREDEDPEGDIEWMLVKFLKDSTESVCHTCEPKSNWICMEAPQ